MEKKDIVSYNYDELQDEIKSIGEKPFRAKQIYAWLHEKLAEEFDEMTNLSKALREKLDQAYEIRKVKVVAHQISKVDPTEKFLFELEDGNRIESVLMKYNYGNSVCISSQVGCRMGCRFCASTLGGLERQMLASEMLDEIYQIQKDSGERVSNVVVMGTGEPLDNYDALVRMIEILTHAPGLDISQRNVTVSTCGIVPKMYELAEEKLQITLALSLHATTDEKRRRLMPIANKYGMKELMDACRNYADKTGRRLTFEYSLVGGVNDGPVLEKTIRDLETLYPYAESLALVPLGLTGHREGLKQLAPIDKKCAEGILDIAEKWQGHFLKKYGTRFVFGADELYIKAGRPIPSYETYEDFKQMEDGVGLLRYLMDGTREALAEFDNRSRHREISIATGVDAAPYITALAEECGKKLDVRVHVYPIRNEFFGETITVTGLLTGGDIISQLRGKALGEKLYVSSCMLRDRENVFLDDLTKEEVSRALGVPLGTIDNEGEDFVRALTGCGED